MAAFLYTAVDPSGRRARGLLDAASAADARAQLRARQLLPISVDATRARRGATPRSRPMGTQALTLTTRQLATLAGAQVRIDDALRIAATEAGTPRAKAVLMNLRSAVQDGSSLADAMGGEPRSFPPHYVAAIRAGERAGRLSEVLDHLARHTEDAARTRQGVRLALIYPALLAAVSLAVIVALLVFVVPDIVRVFTARGADLPPLTRGLIAVSDAAQRYGAAAALLVAAGGAGLVALLRRPGPRRTLDRWLATARPTRGAVLKTNAARYTATLATLVQSGVPLAEALRAATATAPNRHLQDRLSAVTRSVEDGTSLSAAVRASQVFPPMVTAMIASGEQGGTLGDSLARAAADQAATLKAGIAAIVALVEPAVLLVMGGIVMLLVLAILMPIMQLNALAG